MGYTSIGNVAFQSPVNVELPPPHFIKPATSAESDEAEILNLSKSLEKMSFNSPTSEENDGNVEPNLKPVDSRVLSRTSQHKSSFEKKRLKTTELKQEFLLDLEVTDTYRKPSPSLYFEASVGFLPKQIEDLSIPEM